MKEALLQMARMFLVLCPLVLVIIGWAKWLRTRRKMQSGKRHNVIAMGLGAASISCVCYIGLVFYLQKARIGYWNEYLMASRWGEFNWPLSVLAMILGVAGKGSGRMFLLVGGSWLVLVWTMAFIH